MHTHRESVASCVLTVIVSLFAGTVGSATGATFLGTAGPPRDIQEVGVSLDVGDFDPDGYSLHYITSENIDQMLMPFLWPAQSSEPGSPVEVDYAIVQGAIYDVSDGDDLSQVRQAASTWSSVPESVFSFNEVPFDGSWGLGDGSNEIGWLYDLDTWGALELPSSAIGVAYSFRSGGEYTEFDILMNGVYFYWYADASDLYYSESNAMHVGTITLHEMGHATGLLDLYNPSAPGYESWMGSGNEVATMYGYGPDHHEDMTLSWVDEDAMQLAYPTPEPTTLVLLVTGLIAVWVRKRN